MPLNAMTAFATKRRSACICLCATAQVPSDRVGGPTRRGEQPDLAHVISAMEACQRYRPRHDQASGKTFLKPDSGKCLHYYFCFIDEQLGVCYLRVPTWRPFRLQFYCNGHAWLARELGRAVSTNDGR
jgi:hypothetical protein